MARRAIVLGAGGPAAIAWEIGVAAGLAEQGVDLRDADVFVGTSAGSVVAAKLASGQDFKQLFREQAEPEMQRAEPKPAVGFDELRSRLIGARAAGGSATEILKRVGAIANETSVAGASARRAVIGARLPSARWPNRELRIVAVDADRGERVVFGADSGAELVDVVSASCAVPGVWPTVDIGGRRYIDGGVYSTDNADLAGDCDHVLVLALRAREPRLAVVAIEETLDRLAAAGASVELVQPDSRTEAAFQSAGGNLLDPRIRAAAARAGRAQGRALRLAAWGRQQWARP